MLQKTNFILLLFAPLYSQKRNKLLLKIEEKYPNVNKVGLKNTLILLMNQEVNDFVQILAEPLKRRKTIFVRKSH